MYTEYQKFKTAKASPVLLPTSPDIEGPFYKSDAPFRDNLTDKPTFVLSGHVISTRGEPLKNTILDFWQADEQGNYDNEGFNFRGKIRTNENGEYKLHTVIPGDYQIGPGEFRCSHIHVKITVPGYKELTTQLYFADDPYNATDHWFDIDRVIAQNNKNEGLFVFVLAKQ